MSEEPALSSPSLPPLPRVRPLEPIWAEDEHGSPVLVLNDRLGLSDPIAVPQAMAVLLSLCDGTRDFDRLRAAFQLRTGIRLDRSTLEQALQQLDDALVLESPRAAAATAAALADYRSAPFRSPALADKVYPADPSALTEMFDRYAVDAEVGNGSMRGLVSPHIDYQRGGPLYGRTWRRVAPAAREADLVIIFGTDHCGSEGRITLTGQDYATPFGSLPIARGVVDMVAKAIGEQAAFGEELHHRNEHSIELAAVWLHYVRGGRPVEIVPILCGSFHHYVEGEADPGEDETIEEAIEALHRATADRRTLVVAAADLAHVGPAFGDPGPYGPLERAQLKAADTKLLDAIALGDSQAFFGQLRQEGDRRRICGLPPIYLTLRYLDQTEGEIVGYDQCPADESRGSWVSIGGVIFR